MATRRNKRTKTNHDQASPQTILQQITNSVTLLGQQLVSLKETRSSFQKNDYISLSQVYGDIATLNESFRGFMEEINAV